MQKLISVIIPVYNGEQYIGRCIDSVLNQEKFNTSDLEIILLNDGSKDGSLKVLKQYESTYPDIIRVIDQKNMGVAKTRDKGIESSTGKYIMFMDQDDFVDDGYLRIFYDAAESGNYDIVVGGYKRPNPEGKIIRTVSQPNTEYSKRYKISAAWAKIHRADFIKKNKIRFYDNNYGEDIIFTMNENNTTDKILGINYLGHNWFWNDTSVSNTSQRGLQQHIKIVKLLGDMVPHIKTELDAYYVVQTGVHYLLFSGRRAAAEDFVKLYKEIFSLYKQRGVKVTNNKYIMFGPAGALLSVRVAISGFILLHRLNLIGVFARIYCNGPTK